MVAAAATARLHTSLILFGCVESKTTVFAQRADDVGAGGAGVGGSAATGNVNGGENTGSVGGNGNGGAGVVNG